MNEVVARRSGEHTVLARALATSPVRFVKPRFAHTRAATVCVVTFGGGLCDGDAIDLSIVVEPGAVLVVFTQASTKVFRGAARQSIRAAVSGTLIVLPDPVACFAGAHYTQRVDVDLDRDGACVLLDGFTSGRAAFGERWAMNALDLRTTVTRDGRLIARDALLLDHEIPTKMRQFEAYATLLAVGAPAVERAILEEHATGHDLVAAESKLANEGAIVRIAGTSPPRVLADARRRLRNLPEIEAVDPFVSRH